MTGLKFTMRPKDSHLEFGLRQLCNELKPILGDKPTIVELGSYMGESSLIFAEEFPGGIIYCIDSWEGGFDDSDSCSSVNYLDVESQFDLRASSVNNIKKIKSLSTDNSIICDMVYIDACHKYECVKQDIEFWLPITKKVISGHDYYDSEEFLKYHPHVAGVKRAILDSLGTPDKLFIDGSWYKIKK